MLSAERLLNEVTASLRNVIAPAVAESYPKAQAYMAALILEFVSKQVVERTDIASAKEAAIAALFEDIARITGPIEVGDGANGEARLSRLIERLYEDRHRLGAETFRAANDRVRQCLRGLLDEDMKVSGSKGE